MVGLRRSELLTDGKNNADSVEESDDEKILTDDAYGFSRQSPTIATTAPPSSGLGPGPPLRTLLQTTIRGAGPPDSQAGLFPVRSPLLGESL